MSRRHVCPDCGGPANEHLAFCWACAKDYPPPGWKPGDPVNDNRGRADETDFDGDAA